MQDAAPDSADVLARLLEAVPGGVVHVGADGAILRANPAAVAFLGLSFDALTDRYTQDFDGETWFENGERCTAEHYPVSRTLVSGEASGPTTIGVRQPDGAVRWAVFRAVPVEGGGAVVTFLDITERRSAERRLRVSDRLAFLGRLAAGVAHEINNPLTWVMLNLERAIEEGVAEEGIQNALDGLGRVASIVRDLGAFARVDEATPEPFDVHTAVEHAVAIAQQQIRHRAELRVTKGSVPLAFGVESRTVQIILNLLLNAAQAIEPGARERHTITVRTVSARSKVYVEVRDTGPGMNPMTLEHALDPFFTTKAPGEGTGLGLSISHALASAMHGTLEIDSKVGRGTTVRLGLPVAPHVAPPGDAPPAEQTEDRVARVLVVDDESEILEILRWALVPHQVDTARDGREALECLERAAYDVVICDLMMPETTGMQLYERLRAVRPELIPRLVFMTGGAYTDDARDFMNLEHIHCLTKPFSMSEVRRLVSSVLSNPALEPQ